LKSRSIVSAVVAAIVLFGGAAFANHEPVQDGSSERGRLDVKAVQKFGSQKASWRIETWQRWNRYDLWDQGYLALYLDTVGTVRADYYVLIYATSDQLRATVFRDRENKADYVVRHVWLGRRNAKSVSVAFRLNDLQIGEKRSRFRWYVRTTWSGHNCPKVCFDLAPDRARDGEGVIEPLPK
jgi:hypothetical protein